MIEHKNVHEAINAVMQEVGYVKKTSSKELRYTFASETAFIEAVRPAMVEHGLYLYPVTMNHVWREQYSTKSGSMMVNTLESVKYRMQHTPSDTFIEIDVLGEGADVGDKSANKAMTGSYKYALRQVFMIETGDDPDKYASEERVTTTGSSMPKKGDFKKSANTPKEAEKVVGEMAKAAKEVSGAEKLSASDLRKVQNFDAIKDGLKEHNLTADNAIISQAIGEVTEKSGEASIYQVVAVIVEHGDK